MFDWVADFCTYLSELFLSLVGLITDAIWSFFTSFYGWLFEQVAPLFDALFASFGFDVSPGWSVEYWNSLNFFAPVNETLALLTLVFLFWLQVLVIKITLKLIPTIY